MRRRSPPGGLDQRDKDLGERVFDLAQTYTQLIRRRSAGQALEAHEPKHGLMELGQ